MRYFSTNRKSNPVPLRTAVLNGLAEDGGLFMPEDIPLLPNPFLDNLHTLSFHELAEEIALPFTGEEVSPSALRDIVRQAFTFEAQLVSLSDATFVLELFHGPTLSFKDFGARFMARLMSYFRRNEGGELTVLVATSGDTGSAVAQGFYQVEGTRVILLYPSKKVSPLQEKQLTTLGENIIALEIDGSFDDCQKLVKQAFVDQELRSKLTLTSANSINIARLIPQSFYYFHTAANIHRSLGPKHPPLVVSVPSGNFGNLTAGLLAKQRGLKIEKFIAATNINDVVVEYLRSGVFTPRASKKTLSNAMDVGNPSNFARMLELYQHDRHRMNRDVFAASFSDQQTLEAVSKVHAKYDYCIDPHGAVGYLGLEQHRSSQTEQVGIILETAHPAKFMEVMEQVIPGEVEMPPRLATVLEREKQATALSSSFEEFKSFLSD